MHNKPVKLLISTFSLNWIDRWWLNFWNSFSVFCKYAEMSMSMHLSKSELFTFLASQLGYIVVNPPPHPDPFPPALNPPFSHMIKCWRGAVNIQSGTVAIFRVSTWNTFKNILQRDRWLLSFPRSHPVTDVTFFVVTFKTKRKQIRSIGISWTDAKRPIVQKH